MSPSDDDQNDEKSETPNQQLSIKKDSPAANEDENDADSNYDDDYEEDNYEDDAGDFDEEDVDDDAQLSAAK